MQRMPTVSLLDSPLPVPGSDDDVLRLIGPTGERTPNSDLDPWVSDVDDDALVRMLTDMAVVRRVDLEATALQRQGQVGLWPPLLGQEAAQIGSARALREDDFIFPSYRETGVAYCRGVDMLEVLRLWRGAALCGWDSVKFGMGTAQIVIGAQALHAAGYALGTKLDGSDAATITYFGDGATSQGDVNEALVFAASFQAPVLFFCQNNHWAISEPVRVQAHAPLAGRAAGFGIPAVRVDGNDVLACLAATRRALDRVRSGSGPAFIEAVTYRMGPHTTADDPTRYRDPNELDLWKAKDPIARVEAHLVSRGHDAEELRAQLQRAADEMAARLRREVVQIPDPGPLDLFDHVYAAPHEQLERERREYSLYLAQFDDSARFEDNPGGKDGAAAPQVAQDTEVAR